MNPKITWLPGPPEVLDTGMLIECANGEIMLVGDIDFDCSTDPSDEDTVQKAMKTITRHAWLIRPHELEWIEDMARRSRK